MNYDSSDHFYFSSNNLIKRNKRGYLLISFAQGISPLGDLAIQYFFKDTLLLQPYEMSRIFAFIMIPWIIKPILGLLTDLVPIFGFRRKVYLLMCGLISFTCWIYLALIENTIYSMTLLLFTISFCTSFASVIGEAIVVELSNIQNIEEIKQSDEKAKNYVSLFFLFKNTGTFISAFLRGYLVELMSLKNIFLLCSLIPLLIILSGLIIIEPFIPILMIKNNSISNPHSLEELKYHELYSLDPTFDEKKEKLLSTKTKVYSQPVNQFYSNNGLSINKKELLNQFLEFTRKKEVVIPSLFSILLFATPSFSDPFFYYMTNYLHFYPSDLGILSLMTSVGVLIAIFTYRIYFKYWSFVRLVNSSSIMYFLFTFLAYVLIQRWNLLIGISDFIFCNLGFLFLAIFGELSMMPILTLACSICPKNLEATVYSFFMSSINTGLFLSTLNSSFLTYWFNITAHDFTNLGKMIIISNFFNLIPVLVLLKLNPNYFKGTYEELELMKEAECVEAVNRNESISKIII